MSKQIIECWMEKGDSFKELRVAFNGKEHVAYDTEEFITKTKRNSNDVKVRITVELIDEAQSEVQR